MKKRELFCLLLIIIFVFLAGFVISAPTHDHEGGIWVYNFSDDDGISSNSSVDVNTITEKLTLTNSSGGFDAPYNISGYAITTTIMPMSVAAWLNLTFDADVPTNTSVRIQVLDSDDCVFSDTLISGNSEGIASSPINLTPIRVDTIASYDSNAKAARLRILFNLTTNDTSVTPSVSNLNISWIVRRGDLNASTLANTSWPITSLHNSRKGRTNTSYHSTPLYPAVRWVRDAELTYGGHFSRWFNNTIFKKKFYGIIYNSSMGIVEWLDSKMLAIDRTNGSVLYSYEGHITPTVTEHTLSQDGTMYVVDSISDMLIAYDVSDFSVKWTYQFNWGYSTHQVLIDDNGMIYVLASCYDVDLYVFNPDGTVNWTLEIDPTDEKVIAYKFVLINNETLYFGTTIANETPYVPLNEGQLYAINLTNQSIQWNYSTGDISRPILGDDGVIYTASQESLSTYPAYEKHICAIYPNGSLKWERSQGVTSELWFPSYGWGSLREDGTFLTFIDKTNGGTYANQTIIEALNSSNGSLLWTNNMNSSLHKSIYEFTDDLGGFYITNSIEDNGSDYNTLNYYNSEGEIKWKLLQPPLFDTIYNIYGEFQGLMQDEDGKVYGEYISYDSNTSSWAVDFSLYPWTLSASIDADTYNPSNTITFTANTSMQEENPLSNHSNKMQVLMDNDDKVILSYNNTKSDGDTVWTGTYTLPESTLFGEHSFTLEASGAGIQTDITTDFDSPANLTNNTGINTTGIFNIIYQNTHSCSSADQCSGGYCVHGYCRSSSTYCGDGYCDSGEACSSCSSDCGECGKSTKQTKSIHAWTSITPDKVTTMIINHKDIGITKINFKVKNKVSNIQIKVEYIKNNPVKKKCTGKVYQHIQINKEGIEDINIENITINFKVNKTWVYNKNFSSDNIYLNRYFEDDWEKLSTNFTEEDNDYYFYEAETSGFSFFAISGHQYIEDDLEEDSETLIPDTQYWIIVVVVILLIIFFSIANKQK